MALEATSSTSEPEDDDPEPVAPREMRYYLEQKDAGFEAGWQASKERRRVFVFTAFTAPAAVAVTIMAFFLLPAWLTNNWIIFSDKPIVWGPRVQQNFNAAMGLSALVLFMIVGGSVALYRGSQRRIYAMAIKAEAALRRISKARRIAGANAGPHLTDLWDVTERRLDYYHQIAISQAASSFRMAQAAMTAGFVVVMTMAAVATFSKSGTASIVAGALGATGGGLAAYISTTFVRSQETASKSMQSYFLQPTQFYRYLAAERLISTLDPADRVEAVSAIARAIVSGNTDSEEANYNRTAAVD